MAGPQVQGLVLKRDVHPDQVGCQDRLNGQDRQQRQRDERRPPRPPPRPAAPATATEFMVAGAAEASATPPWCRTGIWWHALLAHSRSDPPREPSHIANCKSYPRRTVTFTSI